MIGLAVRFKNKTKVRNDSPKNHNLGLHDALQENKHTPEKTKTKTNLPVHKSSIRFDTPRYLHICIKFSRFLRGRGTTNAK